MAKRIQVGGRIESNEVGGIVTGAAEILDDAKEKKQSVINQETDDELVRLDQSKQDNLTFDNAPTEGSDNPVKSGGVYAADKALSDAIEAILLLIPSAASALNKLVDTSMMNSSISTATATFRGTYNVVTDLSLTVDATHEQIAAALGNAISTADNNDYAFVQVPVSAESTDIRRTERYKFNGTAWGYEYDLNTSGFSAAQWAAINSGITLALVGKLIGLPTSSELQALLGQKQDTLTFDNIPVSGSANPVKSGGVYSVINDEKTAREQLAQTVTGINGRLGDVEEVIPTGAAANNKLVANNSMEAYVTSIIEAITASFTIATADGHINLTLTQTNGRVASLTLTTSDIASAQALTALTGRVSTAEGNITTLGGRVSTNETDIANLQQLYNDLQQSKPVPVTALPETGQQQGVIYRLAGTTSYSDYMWNGSTWVLMATYNNAIDSRPKKASQNLVTSGGVFDNMGALDVSELNATENPHTLAQYADLSAALAAIPTDYQKGGMSIKFVQSSDNKYVQFRFMRSTFTDSQFANPINWQGVDEEPTIGSNNLIKSGGVAELSNLDSEFLYRLSLNSQKINDVVSGITSIAGYWVNVNSGIVSHNTSTTYYGSWQIIVQKGKLYKINFAYATNSSAYSNYGGCSFHTNPLTETVIVNKVYRNCVGVGRFDFYFLAPQDGYISSFSSNLSVSQDAPIIKEVSLSENDYTLLVETLNAKGFLDWGEIKYELSNVPLKSKPITDYWKCRSSGVVYNVTPLEEGIFDGNVTRVTPPSDSLFFPEGEYYSDVYGSNWVNILKQYQIEDGSPLKLYISARIYNAGQATATTIDFRAKYKEGGIWITSGKTISNLGVGDYVDAEFEFTPNYNGLTEPIMPYIYFTNCNGAVIEFGNWDMWVLDPKKRNSRIVPYINPKNIINGISFEQLDQSLQNKISNNDSFAYPALGKKIICSGSSITWGDGKLDGSMVNYVDDFIRNILSKTILPSSMVISGDSVDVYNDVMYKSSGKQISTLNETIEFELYGDELAICQMKKRTSDFGIMEVYADNTLIGTFDNKNTINSETETFTDDSIRIIRLKHPCTFNHQIYINGSSTPLSTILYNTGGIDGRVPQDQTTFDAFVFRSEDSTGYPVHKIQFSTELGTITSVSITYDYGHIEGYERNTLGQTNEANTNESRYGEGSTAYDPDHPAGSLSSGMEFRAVNKNVFFRHQFTSVASRKIKIKLVGGTNPYFIINFASNRYHDLMNAGIGGWALNDIQNSRTNSYKKFYRFFMPEIIFQESETNDDWGYETRRISRSIGEITAEELRAIPWLEIKSVTYNGNTNKYAVVMCTGIIDSISYTSLTSQNIIGTDTQVGDIVRIGNYHGDIKQITCRKITSVDLTTGTIVWKEPIFVEDMLNIDSLNDLVGAEINIRDLSGYKAEYISYIEKVHAITPEAKIVIVDNGLPMLGLRQLWGYDVIHREVVSETDNTEYLDARSVLYEGQFDLITGARKYTFTPNGSSEYNFPDSFSSYRNSWCGFKVLVNGIDVYGKDCYVQCQGAYRAKSSLSGSDLNKTTPYHRSNATDIENPLMKLVFTRNAPTSGDTLEVQLSDNIWSTDFCHPITYGAYLYGKAYSKLLQ